MDEFLNNLIANLLFIFERLNWLSVVDILLVAAVFYGLILLMRGTQAMVLLRGIMVLVVLLGILTSLDVLPAFSWLVLTTLPAMLLAIPVIFAPEIRLALERLGRAGSLTSAERSSNHAENIQAVMNAVMNLSDRRHGALIVLQRRDELGEYERTGVKLGAQVSAELLLQIFYPNTPLHDGAAIISGDNVVAAACVLPLSSSGVLAESPDRQMGLRHRAALGISEVSDAVTLVVSEETGGISVTNGGRIIRRLEAERLKNILNSFYQPPRQRGLLAFLRRIFGQQRLPEEQPDE